MRNELREELGRFDDETLLLWGRKLDEIKNLLLKHVSDKEVRERLIKTINEYECLGRVRVNSLAACKLLNECNGIFNKLEGDGI